MPTAKNIIHLVPKNLYTGRDISTTGLGIAVAWNRQGLWSQFLRLWEVRGSLRLRVKDSAIQSQRH